MIGTRGVPARYGGFETAIEEVGSRLVTMGHDVVVYCRGEDRSDSYLACPGSGCRPCATR